MINLRTHPRIVLTEKFAGSAMNHENFAFLKLLLSGCWRSEEEMRLSIRASSSV
jgi:hypothetical protein